MHDGCKSETPELNKILKVAACANKCLAQVQTNTAVKKCFVWEKGREHSLPKVFQRICCAIKGNPQSRNTQIQYKAVKRLCIEYYPSGMQTCEMCMRTVAASLASAKVFGFHRLHFFFFFVFFMLAITNLYSFAQPKIKDAQNNIHEN